MITSKHIIKLTEVEDFRNFHIVSLNHLTLSRGDTIITFEFWISSQRFFYSGTSSEIKNAIIREIAHYKGLVKEYYKKFKAIKPDPSGKPSQVEERLDVLENIYEQLQLVLKEYLKQAKSKGLL